METLTVPSNVVYAAHFIERNFVAFVGALVIAIVASLVVEVINRKKIKPHFNLDIEAEKRKARKLANWALAAVTVLFTSLGYIATFAHWAAPALSQYPVLAEACLSIYGASNFLYNVRLNKTWDTWATRISAWSSSKTTPVTATPIVSPTELQPTVASEDQLA